MPFTRTLIAALLVAPVGTAFADVVQLADRALFNQQGTIAVTSNFDDFAPSVTTLNGQFYRGDIAYKDTAVFGKNSPYVSPHRNTIGTKNLPPSEMVLAPGTRYSLLGFDTAVEAAAPVTFVMTTNLGKFSFPDVSLPSGKEAIVFKGFATTKPGEYFISFLITTPDDYIGITDISLGNIAPTAGAGAAAKKP